jgi:AcrR family transcriptional regulator
VVVDTGAILVRIYRLLASHEPIAFDTVNAMGRRDDVIAAATALLRESGPVALTSVNVAARLGVTQSAIYRHIRDMDELRTIASQAVVGELTSVMVAAVSAPETEWGDGGHLEHFADRLVALIAEHESAFQTIDRWHHADGELGEGIRRLLDLGAQLIAGEMETHWREDFDYDAEFDDSTNAAQLAHSGLTIDDLIAVARSVHAAGPERQLLARRTLGLRMFTGWCGYVLEMNHRLGLPIPALGGPKLPSPEYSLV